MTIEINAYIILFYDAFHKLRLSTLIYLEKLILKYIIVYLFQTNVSFLRLYRHRHHESYCLCYNLCVGILF